MDATPTSDRPAVSVTEIEVTPEMIAAGVAEFHGSRGMIFDTPESAVWSIFKAMIAGSPTLRSLPLREC